MGVLKDPYKPKYLQLVDIIRHKIISGELKEGDKLLSENELREEYGVSSTTVRKCIDILKGEGYIDRQQGIGTFIKRVQVERSLQKILSFTKNMEQAGLAPSTRVLEKQVLSTYGTYHEKLSLGGEDSILMIKRIRYGDDEPMMLEKRYINVKLCSDIHNQDLSGSLYNLYKDVYGIELVCTQQHLRLIFLEEEEAGLLHCDTNVPAFYVTGITYGDDEVPLEYEESLYRGDTYEFYIDIKNC